jgi:hypothetical protein
VYKSGYYTARATVSGLKQKHTGAHWPLVNAWNGTFDSTFTQWAIWLSPQYGTVSAMPDGLIEQ